MDKAKKIFLLVSLAVFSLMVRPVAALASVEVAPLPEDIQLEPPKGFEGLADFNVVSLIQAAIRLVLIIAALLFFFVLVIGGIRWITAGGDKAGVETARKMIINALLGLAIVFSAWAIAALIGNLFGVDILNLELFSIAQ